MTTPVHGAATPQRAITVVWLALAAVTLLSWWLAPAHSDGPAGASVPITLAVIALGAVKCRLIIRHFMEVRQAPRWLRMSTDAWLLVLWAAVTGIYLW